MEIEVDEVRRINSDWIADCGENSRPAIHSPQSENPQSSILNPQSVEAWAGVNGSTRRKSSTPGRGDSIGRGRGGNRAACHRRLAERDIVRFFQRDVAYLLEASKSDLPIFLYDNADINAQGQPPHIRTRIVKHLSRLPWLRASKSRRRDA